MQTEEIHLGTLFAQLLEGSNAKIHNEKLIVFVKDKDTKIRLNQDKYHAAIITNSKEYLNLNVEDVHIISFEEPEGRWSGFSPPLNRIWVSEGVKGQDELALLVLDSRRTVIRLNIITGNIWFT